MPDGPLLPASSSIEAVLTRRDLLTGASLDRARRLEAESGERIDRIAAKLGMVSDADLANAYAELLGSPVLTAAAYPTAPVLPDLLRKDFLKHARVIPIAADTASVTVAMADPLDEAAIAALGFALEMTVIRRAALPAAIEAAFARLYGDPADEDGAGLANSPHRADEDRDADLERLKDLASEAPVIRLVNALITRAVELRASDIHIEAADNRLRVRYRIDGVLHDIDPPPVHLKNAIVSRVKIMAKLNIAERRLPQDGRIRQPVRGKEIDFRVSVIPTIHGESVVLRILDRGSPGARPGAVRLRSCPPGALARYHPPHRRHRAGHRPDQQRQDQRGARK